MRGGVWALAGGQARDGLGEEGVVVEGDKLYARVDWPNPNVSSKQKTIGGLE